MREGTGTVVLFIMSVTGVIYETATVCVVTAETLSLQTDEEQTVIRILMQLTQFVAQQQGIVSLLTVTDHFYEIAIVADETVVCGHPHKTLGVLRQTDDIVAGQTVGGIKFAVFQFNGSQFGYTLQQKYNDQQGHSIIMVSIHFQS